MGTWEELEHTADVGLRVEGDDLGDLFATAAFGMFALIGEASFAPDEIRPVELEVRGDTAAERLRDFLRALLAEFAREGFFPTEIRVSDDGSTTRATGTGGRFDPARHEFRSEIKGVTWHGFRVERSGDRWRAEIVFDV